MSSSSQWLAYLSPSDVKHHKRWLKRGCQSSGRIVLENINLRGIVPQICSGLAYLESLNLRIVGKPNADGDRWFC